MLRSNDSLECQFCTKVAIPIFFILHFLFKYDGIVIFLYNELLYSEYR